MRVVELAVVGDHFADEEQTALDGDEPDEIRGDAADVGRSARMASSALSWSSAENTGLRTSRSRSGLSAISASNSRERLGDGVGLALVLGEREQGGGVAARDSRNDRVVLCQARHLVQGVHAPTRCRPNGANPQEFAMNPLLENERAGGSALKARVA